MKTHLMGLRVVREEGESVRAAFHRLTLRMLDGGVFDEIGVHGRFLPRRFRKRLKRELSRQRARDRAACERLGLPVPDFAQ